MATPEAQPGPPPPRPPGGAGRRSSLGRHVALFVILALFWFILSGRIGVQYVVFMLISVGIVLALNPERPFGAPGRAEVPSAAGRVRAGIAFVRFLAWLVWKVIGANIDVAVRILHPRLPIRPQLMRFRTGLRNEVAQVLMANSITLTPGTVTIDLKDGEFLVHSLHPATTGAILSGELERAIAPIFGEQAGDPPEVEWTSTYRDLAG